MTEYNKQWYEDNKEYHKEQVRKYYRTKRGKAVSEAADKRFRKNNPNYYKDYMKHRRTEAKKKGICNICFARKALKPYVACTSCKERLILNNMKRKNKK